MLLLRLLAHLFFKDKDRHLVAKCDIHHTSRHVTQFQQDVIFVRQKEVKGFLPNKYRTPVNLCLFSTTYFLPGTFEEKTGSYTMSLNRLFVLTNSLKVGRRLLPRNGQSGKEVLSHLQLQRSIKTNSRNLAYAKDLFLGKVNKVR